MKRFMNSLLSGQVLHGTDWPVFRWAKRCPNGARAACATTC